MSRTVKVTGKYTKSVKRMAKRGYDISQLDTIVGILSSRNLTSDEIHKYRDHPLSGKYSGYRDIHIGGSSSDWVLIYKIEGSSVILEDTVLILKDTGTHSDLFESTEILSKQVIEMKRYISAGAGIPRYKFKWVNDEYTGGNIIIAYGQLEEGRYFSASYADYDAFILDADPMVEHNEPTKYSGDYYGDDYDWLLEHSVVNMTEQDMIKFWISLLQYCKRNNIHLYTYDNYDAAIRELKSML